MLVICSFADQTTLDIYNGLDSKKARQIPHQLWKIIHRKLDMLQAAHELADLRIPPANRLERLKGALKDFYSIRINDQYRIVFQWKDNNVFHVQITDYH